MKQRQTLGTWLIAWVVGMLTPWAVFAIDYTAAIQGKVVPEIRKLLLEPEVLEAIKAQNATNASLDPTKITALDEKWQLERAAGSGELLKEHLESPLSKRLQQIVADSNGKYTEIFLMDNKGLNVAQSQITTDFWQGDEDKFQKTFGAGAQGWHISDLEMDESTAAFQCQLSLTVNDSDGQTSIGAATVGIQVNKL